MARAVGREGFSISVKAATGRDEMTDTSPLETTTETEDGIKLTRYQQVANTLLSEIESGQHAIGSLLPTEHELCARFNVSRYTVREALRRLFEAGLVARRRGAGTTVIATKRPPLYDLSVTSVNDIFQYAKNTQFEINGVEETATTGTLKEELGGLSGDKWSTVTGLRYSDMDPRPVGLSRIYVNSSLDKVASRLSQPFHIIRDFIEIAFEVPVSKMEQSVRASVIEPDDARLLRVESGSAALRIVRRFLSNDGGLIQVVDNLHPSDRFSLSMTFDRDDSAS